MTNVLFRPRWHFSSTKGCITLLIGLPAPSRAVQLAVYESTELNVIIAVLAILFSIMVLTLCQSRYQQRRLKRRYERFSTRHEALLEQKFLWHAQEAKLTEQNQQLERRLNARTETINRINHELTQTLEQLQRYEFLNNSLKFTLNNSDTLVLIIDKHYRVRFCSRAFLDYTGMHVADVQDKPLRQLEQHICLPEMASEGFTLNEQGWLETKLKCRDARNTMHVFNARISLNWSNWKEIVHYVIVIDKKTKAEPA